MGKSFELLGLAAFNVFLALILSITFLGGDKVSLDYLTKDHVEKFISEVNDITTGTRQDMDNYSVTSYFMKHIADDSKFVNNIKYEIPRVGTQERTMEMSKLDFISHILQGMQNGGDDRETSIAIEHIEIAEHGKAAKVITTNMESGMMPFDDGSGSAQMLPVTGVSFCEQTVVLSDKNIQMETANCTTDVSFNDY